jgi:hypothetical protein
LRRTEVIVAVIAKAFAPIYVITVKPIAVTLDRLAV